MTRRHPDTSRRRANPNAKQPDTPEVRLAQLAVVQARYAKLAGQHHRPHEQRMPAAATADNLQWAIDIIKETL